MDWEGQGFSSWVHRLYALYISNKWTIVISLNLGPLSSAWTISLLHRITSLGIFSSLFFFFLVIFSEQTNIRFINDDLGLSLIDSKLSFEIMHTCRLIHLQDLFQTNNICVEISAKVRWHQKRQNYATWMSAFYPSQPRGPATCLAILKPRKCKGKYYDTCPNRKWNFWETLA